MNYFNKIPELKAYLPEDIKELSISREYLLNVRFIYKLYFRYYFMYGGIYIISYIKIIKKLKHQGYIISGMSIILKSLTVLKLK